MTEHEREQLGQAHATATALLLELKEMPERAKVMSDDELFHKFTSLTEVAKNHCDAIEALLPKEENENEQTNI